MTKATKMGLTGDGHLRTYITNEDEPLARPQKKVKITKPVKTKPQKSAEAYQLFRQNYRQNPPEYSSGRETYDLYRQTDGQHSHPPPQIDHGTPENTPSCQKNDANFPNNKPKIIVHPTRIVKSTFQDNDASFHNNDPHTNPQSSVEQEAYYLYQQYISRNCHTPSETLPEIHASNFHENHPDTNPLGSIAEKTYDLYQQSPHLPHYGGDSGASGSGNEI